MKVRNGFVSNSSSSSFCIFGANLEVSSLPDQFYIDRFDAIRKTLSEYYGASDITTVDEMKEYIESDDLERELFETMFPQFETYYVDYEGHFVGRSWSSIGDDETGKQFKDSVEAILKSIDPEIVCDTYEMEYPC